MQSAEYRAQSTEHRALVLLVILVVDKMQNMQQGIFDNLTLKWEKNAIFVELNSTKNVVWGNNWSYMMLQSQKTKKLRCGQRNKMFTTSRHLANPQIMHNEKRVHECNICDEVFKRKGRFRLH